MVADCVTLWIGDSLGRIERACLKSMLRQGHRVALYCYQIPEGVPAGVEILDASDVLPRSLIPASWSKRSDLYSDWFRYEVQRRGLGTWLDLDIYLVAPLDLERAYLFGREDPRFINGAVLRLPASSPMLPELLRQFDGHTIPRSMRFDRRIEFAVRRLVTGEVDLARTPWGTTGPAAVTECARRFNLTSEALPREVFYPAGWPDAKWILDPEIKLEDLITERTVAVHLWNELIKPFKNAPAPEGSFLARLQSEGRS